MMQTERKSLRAQLTGNPLHKSEKGSSLPLSTLWIRGGKISKGMRIENRSEDSDRNVKCSELDAITGFGT
jgi:hypothetical protein